MTRLPARWEELAWPELRALDAERTVVLMPVGAIEQHGPHLPLSVDALVVEALSAAAIARAEPGLGLLVLPVCPFGKSDEHLDYPGTIALSAATLQALWCEIGASVARAGFKKLLMLNGHGGQVATAQIVARELRIRHRMLVVSCLWPQLGLPEGILPADELRFGIHAGALETALVQAIRPELVRGDRIARFEPTTRERAARAPILGSLGASGFGWMAQDLHPSGAAGDAGLARAELGRRVLDHVADRLLELVRELRDEPLEGLGSGPLGRG